MNKLLSYVIPCYNSTESLTKVVDEIIETVKTRNGYDYEIILVNDNAPDATWELIENLSAENPNIHGVCMAHNFGQHSALMAGFRKAKGDIVVALDDDGQTPPSESFKLIDRLQGNVNVVYGDYPDLKFASKFREFGSNVNDWMAEWLLNKPHGLYLSSFIAARRNVIDQVVQYGGPYPYVDGLMLRSGSEIVNEPVEHREREFGQSGYSLKKLLELWVNGFTAFSVKPLRAGTLIGVLIAGLGFAFGAFIFIQKLIYRDAVNAGWSSIVCILMMLGGLILIMLGLIGEYVGRIYLSINSTPQYIVLKETESAAEQRKKTAIPNNNIPS